MKIIRMEVGHLGTNCYIIYCEKTREAIVVDPGGNGTEIVALLNRENLDVKFIDVDSYETMSYKHNDKLLEEIRDYKNNGFV